MDSIARAETQDTLSPGLTSAEVAERIARGEVNRTSKDGGRTFGQILRANLLTRFNAIVGALFVLVMIFGAPQDGLFGLVILVNSLIGIVQELRAKQVLGRLAVLGQEPVRVRRDGAETAIAPTDVVLGEVVLLGTGDRIPVDGVLDEATALEVDESLLTGESDPVVKVVGDTVKSGSFVVSGGGAFTATAVGDGSYAAQLVQEASRFSMAKSELQTGINKFLGYITWLILPVGVLLAISQLNAADSFAKAVVGSVAGVVPMIPEGLVLMTSIAFTVGVLRLGRRRTMVQELPAVEVLARVDVLCLDKTGTLTDATMDLKELRVLSGDEQGARDAVGALIAAEPRPNPTMQAIARGVPGDPGWTVTDSVAFSSARKWSGASFAGQGSWVMGAADVLLSTEDAHRAGADELASQGLRVLVLGKVGDLNDFEHAEAVALVVLAQRIRPEAEQTLRYFAEQGVAIKVISGDNAASVGAVAAGLGIPGAQDPVDARTLPTDRAELAEVMETHSVFGRVSPQQKREFVAALQSKGHVVAMTGDGVNDVLALKDADLGVAMGSGSGATRSVAKVVLMDDSFASLPHVVAEGRRVLNNVERVANLFLTKTFYSVALALLIGVAGLPFPFLPRHVTLIGALTIGIPGFLLALAPNTERARPGFVPRVLRFAVPAGLACAAATFGSYWLAYNNPGSDLTANQSTATLALFLTSLWALALVARPWTWLRAGLVLLMVAGFALVTAVPWSRDQFQLNFANPGDDLVALGIAVGMAALLTLVLWLERWLGRRSQVASRV
ncbi:HAD-IC family P-type ATPase [Kutzneria viridogrisea]|uniref:Cation-transporting ATPase E n=1 Tax=Kutzneria viridogrisea TaxID=47990 RepID=A0ABR6BU22_9PSEU|nr:HAD-IC family P-type ATPase [Kutzneria albida]MBA8930421.1 cation-transporting ATPase E [Kutzneria viridogrisea]